MIHNRKVNKTHGNDNNMNTLQTKLSRLNARLLVTKGNRNKAKIVIEILKVEFAIELLKPSVIKMTQFVTPQQIGKLLKKGGLKKATTERVNFQTYFVGHYEVRHLKRYGLNNIVVSPKNGTTAEQIISVLKKQGIEADQIRGLVYIV